MELILASQSPRRRELLGLLQIPFTVRIADIDETMDPALEPAQAVAQVSRRKALAVPRSGEDVVIAADTIVVCQGRILGKPATAAQAEEMLRLLSGREHQVMTGLCILRADREIVTTEVTTVHFRPVADWEIARYVASGEPMDKAGAYGIQGGASLFCSGITGDYYNVVGLPVCKLWEVLGQIAPEWMGGSL